MQTSSNLFCLITAKLATINSTAVAGMGSDHTCSKVQACQVDRSVVEEGKDGSAHSMV